MSTPEPPPPGRDERHEDERVPLFGSWPRIHGAVIVWAVVVMVLLAVFSRWPF